MIEYRKGNIFDADVDAIVNTVNCVGVMGRGIALQFKNLFPDNFKAYKIACDNKKVIPGKMFTFKTNTLTDQKFIINFPTKRHWKGKSRIEDIVSGLDDLKLEIAKNNIRSIAIPPLGSGMGGLNWEEVREIIKNSLKELNDTHVIIYEPIENSIKTISKDIPNMTSGRSSLILLIKRYLDGLMDPSITLIEIQKLMYFMQEFGADLRLNYKKYHYGPYADNLRYVLNKIEGHFICGYYDGGDSPNKSIELVPGAIKDAEEFLQRDNRMLKYFDSVSNLVSGFESPFGLELLSTVHWVLRYENAKTYNDVLTKIYNWNKNKHKFSKHHISVAYKIIKEKTII